MHNILGKCIIHLLTIIQMRMLRIFCLLLFLFIFSCSDRESGRVLESTADNKKQQPETQRVKTIVFFGNSLTAGYGLNQSEAFPALIQKKLDSLDLKFSVINAGVSGETTSGGNTRVNWILQQPVDIFILELGANDGLRGIPINETRLNLQSIIDKVKVKYPGAVILLAGMQIPPNMGPEYTTQFRNLFSELAQKNNISLIPFLLQGVGGESDLNQPDGIHPTAEGHKILAENVWHVLEKHLFQ